jgi:salicylate hydroxylase
MSGAHVLIAGAGIGGVVAALALVERGCTVALYEQAVELRELGAGLQITPNGSRVLCELGLEAALAAIASVPASRDVRLFTTGQTWRLHSSNTVQPFWLVHRGDLHEVLLRTLAERAPGTVHVGSRCVGFGQDAAGVALLLENGHRVHGDVLIGADGVHSRVRGALFGCDKRAAFTGFVAWRAVVPMGRLPDRLRQKNFTMWSGATGHIVTYPLRRGQLLNFVGVIQRGDWLVESWSEAGTVQECRRDFSSWHEDAIAVIEAIDVPYKWALAGRQPLPYWSVGRVSLLGDACHPTLPFMAQGANMAIEDAMVLARCLSGCDDVAMALGRYEAARLERTSQIVLKSLESLPRLINPELADSEQATAFMDREYAPGRVVTRYDWLYEYDAVTVSI